ncbi:endonuclease VII domain-containing protein [Spirillospora sp. NPDC048911]|uniref:endonuclease VII domain-containing protein n=1 Tax=Spirillospora sp. NPDC048911 TaxID=3364527 RepID=UPI0037224617
MIRLGLQSGDDCPICRSASAAHVDHCHETGAVRGLLCPECNTGMGQLRDDPATLRRAADYLEERGSGGATTRHVPHAASGKGDTPLGCSDGALGPVSQPVLSFRSVSSARLAGRPGGRRRRSPR